MFTRVRLKRSRLDATNVGFTVAADSEYVQGRGAAVASASGEFEFQCVSSRSSEARQTIVPELFGWGIRYTALHLLPSLSAARTMCPHVELNGYQHHQSIKSITRWNTRWGVEDDDS